MWDFPFGRIPFVGDTNDMSDIYRMRIPFRVPVWCCLKRPYPYYIRYGDWAILALYRVNFGSTYRTLYFYHLLKLRPASFNRTNPASRRNSCKVSAQTNCLWDWRWNMKGMHWGRAFNTSVTTVMGHETSISILHCCYTRQQYFQWKDYLHCYG
jgi:hypothetical protein